MNAAEAIVHVVLEEDDEDFLRVPSDAEQLTLDLPGSPEPSRAEKYKKALETLRHLRGLEGQKQELYRKLDLNLAIEHALAVKGLRRKDVERYVYRAVTPLPMTWRTSLKHKGDPRWKEAQEDDILGVYTKDGQKIMFDEWVGRPKQ